MPAQQKSAEGPALADRKYRVIKGTVGPFGINHVFSEQTIREFNAPPKRRDGDRDEPDLDDYYGSLIDRLLALQVIAPVTEETPETPHPLAPSVKPGAYSASVKEATRAVLAQRAASAQSVAAPPPEVPATPTPAPATVHQGAPTLTPQHPSPPITTSAPITPAPAPKK